MWGLRGAMGDLQELFTHNFIIGLLSRGRAPAGPVCTFSPRLLLETGGRGAGTAPVIHICHHLVGESFHFSVRGWTQTSEGAMAAASCQSPKD